jgi:acetolactate synthase I/II/III large subunit
VVVLVFNDGGYGVLRNLQQAQGKNRAAVDLVTPDFAGLSASLGLDHRRIGAPEDARPTLEEAVALRGPVVVEIDLAAYGDMAAPFTPPVTVPESTGRRP